MLKAPHWAERIVPRRLVAHCRLDFVARTVFEIVHPLLPQACALVRSHQIRSPGTLGTDCLGFVPVPIALVVGIEYRLVVRYVGFHSTQTEMTLGFAQNLHRYLLTRHFVAH